MNEADKKPFRFEESEGMLIAYSGNYHITPEIYQDFFEIWERRLATPKPFGIVMVFEPHEHKEGEERDGEEEQKFMRILNDFRRNNRALSNQWTTGFARVFPEAWLEGISEEKLALREANENRRAEYMFGIRGKGFTAIEEAKNWLHEMAKLEPLPLEEKNMSSSGSIGLYYGSTTGTTEAVAEKVQEFATAAGVPLNAVNISDLNDPKELLQHEQLIIGIPTWNIGQLQDDWLIVYPKLDEMDFTGKIVAIFGVGDQEGFPDNFLDAVGILGKKLQERGATLIGSWSAEDYDYEDSEAAFETEEGVKFMGLGIDEYNQEEKTDMRIINWLEQIQLEMQQLQAENVESALA